MNRHTARRKRRRANALLKNPASVRPHRKRGGRTGQAGKKAIAARLVQEPDEKPKEDKFTRLLRRICREGQTITRMDTGQWRVVGNKFIPQEVADRLMSAGLLAVASETPTETVFIASEQAHKKLADLLGERRP